MMEQNELIEHAQSAALKALNAASECESKRMGALLKLEAQLAQIEMLREALRQALEFVEHVDAMVYASDSLQARIDALLPVLRGVVTPNF